MLHTACLCVCVQDVEVLVKALSEQEAKLEYLDLSYNSISDGGVAHLAKYLNVSLYDMQHDENVCINTTHCTYQCMTGT